MGARRVGRRIVWAVVVMGAACQRAPLGARRPAPSPIVDAGSEDLGAGEPAPAADAFPDATSIDASAPLCPPDDTPEDGGPTIPALTPKELWGQPTPLPFSCAPLASTLFLASPGADVPGAYARCASFAPPRVAQLAVRSDGRRAAMVGTDGVVRIVDVAARAVVGVLAPPRSVVGLAAFSPSGDAILTVARGEREATLWRADTFTPIWTTKLPGQTYYLQYNGAAAFSPDGRSAIVSPGADLFLLDVTTGAIRAPHASASFGVVLAAAYGWNGRRIAVVDSQLGGHCIHSPYGGTVTILDPDTLTASKPLMTWGGYGSSDSPRQAAMLVAPGADLVLTPGSSADPGMKAFRLSDGARLDPPAVSSFPMVFLPGGVRAIVYQDRELRVVDVVTGEVVAATPIGDAPMGVTWAEAAPVAVAADGSMLLGGRGAGLLRIWRPASGGFTSVCTAEDRASDQAGPLTALSADGRALAVDWGTEVRLVRRSDGKSLSTMRRDGQTIMSLQGLSPDSRYLVAGFYEPTQSTAAPAPTFPMSVFRTSDGARILELGDRFFGRFNGFFLFDQERRQLYARRSQSSTPAGTPIDRIDLETGQAEIAGTVPANASIAGLSKDCFVFTVQRSGAWRSCDGCEGPLFAAGAESGILSPDGRAFASRDGHDTGGGTTLWRVLPVPTPVRVYPNPAEGTEWNLRGIPIAISNSGRRIFTGITSDTPCYSGPGYALQVHDVATDTLVDSLPPGLTSADAELRVLAYGPQLWCARE